jgi:hypothetical protein
MPERYSSARYIKSINAKHTKEISGVKTRDNASVFNTHECSNEDNSVTEVVHNAIMYPRSRPDDAAIAKAPNEGIRHVTIDKGSIFAACTTSSRKTGSLT